MNLQMREKLVQALEILVPMPIRWAFPWDEGSASARCKGRFITDQLRRWRDGGNCFFDALDRHNSVNVIFRVCSGHAEDRRSEISRQQASVNFWSSGF